MKKPVIPDKTSHTINIKTQIMHTKIQDNMHNIPTYSWVKLEGILHNASYLTSYLK